MKMKCLRQFCGLIALLILMICTPIVEPTSALYASNSNQPIFDEPLETITLADGTRVAKDIVVVYATSGGNHKRSTSSDPLPSPLQVVLPCSSGGNHKMAGGGGGGGSCQPASYNLTIVENQSLLESSTVVYGITTADGLSVNLSASDYDQIVTGVRAQLVQTETCTAPAIVMVAGNSWASGGNSWASGGNSWASGGNSWASGGNGTADITYTEAYADQWSLEMIEKSANLYGTGNGHQVAFIDVFNHDSAAQAGLSIVTDTAILYAAVPTTNTVDLTLHGNVVHSIFDSVAPNVANAIGIPVFNRAGEAINAGVVRGVEVALANLPNNSIINMSFGIENDAIDHCTKDALDALFADAESRGITLVASAGNAGSDDAEYPASSNIVHGVAAVGPDRQPTAYSNVGQIAAPGGTDDATLIVRVPLMGPFNELAVLPQNGRLTIPPQYEDRYAEATGTSFAAPYVSATIANLLSDGNSPQEIPATLTQIQESNCGIVSLNPFYATECLEYEETMRSDYGVQRLPHPNYGPEPATWNTEPYWIGTPPCEANGHADEVCYPDNTGVARPYLYAQGSRKIGGTLYLNAAAAYNAYSSAPATATLRDYSIQIVKYTGNGMQFEQPVWIDLPDVCDPYSTALDTDLCAMIQPVAPPVAIFNNDFYYYGARPVKSDMIIMDDHNCQGFDGKMFANAVQAECLYRATSGAMTEIAPADNPSEEIPPIIISGPIGKVRSADVDEGQSTSVQIYVPVVAR